jgi:rhodanese-related sulfurtransferase
MTKPSLDLEKRIPKNPRYASVPPVVNTGAVASKLKHKPMTDQQISKRRNELFKRVRPSRVADVLKSIEAAEQPESIYDMTTSEPCSKYDCNSVQEQSVLSSGGQSVGAFSRISWQSQGIVDARNFLIVDLRPIDDYSQSRVMYAINHPGSLISRDVMQKSLHAFKRKQKGKYLLVYHSDDRNSALFATLLCDKGWEEVYIMDGGFDEFNSCYPELIETDNVNSAGSVDIHLLSNK